MLVVLTQIRIDWTWIHGEGHYPHPVNTENKRYFQQGYFNAPSQSFSKCIFLVAQLSAAFVEPYAAPANGSSITPLSNIAAAVLMGIKRGVALFFSRLYTD